LTSLAKPPPIEAEEAVREVLVRRAARLRAPIARTDEAEDLFWVARFALGEEIFGFPLRSLRAAIPLRRVTPVPLAPPGVVGILRFEGAMVTALSLASLLGLRSWRNDPTLLLVLESANGHLVAVDCGEMPTSVALPLGIAGEPRDLEGAVTYVQPKEGSRIGLIDLSSLLASAKLGDALGA
jgi:chemotaxis signal transduction protein